MTKQFAVGELFTEAEIKKAQRIYKECNGVGFNRRVVAEILTPEVMQRIAKVTGQENVPQYLGYALEYALSK